MSGMSSHGGDDLFPRLEFLRCPLSGQSLRLAFLDEAEAAACTRFVPQKVGTFEATGRTKRVLIREDESGAYPVIGSIPVLMGPELLIPASNESLAKMDHLEVYREAIEEKSYYSAVAEQVSLSVANSPDVHALGGAAQLRKEERNQFPSPYWIWVDAVYDSRAQLDGLAHLAPVNRKRILQIGGRGRAAVKLLLAGASEGWLITPVLAEAQFAISLAKHFDCGDRLRVLVGVAEELPFSDSIFDGIYLGGSLHHTVTSMSLPEASRVLKSGGRFAAIEPWRTPIYGIGTRILGKREREIQCQPLTPDRVAPVYSSFKSAELRHYGAFTRYVLIMLDRFGLKFGLKTVWNIFKADDAVGGLITPVKNIFGGSVAVLAGK